ncbi:MAG: SDR family NAD(P)-dependent oxidoreductase, partial [Pseudomonadota bacterium]|nr:SDR family NAD(P)-dependent oxidoreductase [Pseudomonadota bacterium]
MQASYDMHKDVAVITGGAMGIGLACAQRLASHGAKIALWDVDKGALDAAAATFDNAPLCLQVDITNPDEINAAAAQTAENFGSITQLLNSAGIAGAAIPTIEYSTREWERVIDLNLNGTFFVNRAILPFMQANKYGRIVNVASIAGKEGNPNAGAYSASKAGVIGLTKTLGKEMA